MLIFGDTFGATMVVRGALHTNSLPIFQYALNRELVERRLAMFFKKTLKRLGPKNFAPISSKFLPHFPSSPATKRKDSVGGTTRSSLSGIG